ncbi:DUF418 domain-containing protein [Brevundimonas sp. NPDC092305]|uniref:DUF418 domain-containing protein n=1 Tax=Brevundimonas sp. NPDC092305 TaxID=3363957 RepID=UPI0037FAC9C9
MTTDAIQGGDAAIGPVAPKDRIFTLDMLRGWAILGILAVNAMAFAWPATLVMGGMHIAPFPHDQANILGHWATDAFFQDKFRSLFSMLFGVSIFLIGGERYDETRGPLLTRRLMWLGLFGLIHGFVFWYGDILLHYAYTGLLVMMVRSWSAKKLIWTGMAVNGVFAILSLGMSLLAGGLSGGGQGQGNPFAATPEQLQAVIDAYRSGWPAGLIENLKAALMLQTMSVMLIPITGGLMMLGLGLFKAGFLTGRSATWIYAVVGLIGVADLVGFAWYDWLMLSAPRGAPDPTHGVADAFGSFAPLITLGYVSLLILMTKFGLRALTARLAPVGRMAFTNYLTQTLIMATLFYMPWGPHWLGDPAWGPGRLWIVIGAIWVLQLIWSPLWLSRFQMGPLEWLWRCLTYGRRVPLTRPAG